MKEDVDFPNEKSWKELLDKKYIVAIFLAAVVVYMVYQDYPYSDLIAVITIILELLGLKGNVFKYKVKQLF